MEWIFLGALAVTFIAAIVALMLIMILFPITRWIVLGLGIGAVVATLLFIGAETTTWIPVGFGAGTIGILILCPILVWFVLAPSNRFFTFVKEGTAKATVKADKFDRILLQWEGHTLDDQWNVVPIEKPVKNGQEVPEGTTDARVYGPPKGFRIGGLRLYGLWPVKDVYIYTFQWTGVTEDGRIDRHPKEIIDYILVRDDAYLCEVKDAEDKDLLPLTFLVVLTIRIVNPYKALFNIQNWLETILNRTRPLIRNYATTRSYQEMIANEERIGVDILKGIRDEVTLGADFWDRYGVDIRKVDVIQIEPPQEYRDLTLRKYRAERERERIEIEAQAEATRIGTVYDRIRDFKELGELVRTLEAMEKSPQEGSKWVIPLPGLTDLFRTAFGKTPEDATREEIRELREIIERISATLTEQQERGGQAP